MSQECHITAPPFTRQHVIDVAEALVTEFVLSTEPKFEILRLKFDDVYEQFIYPKYGIELVEDVELGFAEDGSKVLGYFEIDENIAYIDASLQPQFQDPRRAFTCWHEVGGHGVLQGDWLRRELKRIEGSRAVVTTEATIDMATTNRLERQANLFAAHAAAPSWLLEHAIRETFTPTRPMCFVGSREYTLSVKDTTRRYQVEDFGEFCRLIAWHIRWRFGGLSTEALSYRVAGSPLVVDKSRRSFGLYRSTQNTASRLPLSGLSGGVLSPAGV